MLLHKCISSVLLTVSVLLNLLLQQIYVINPLGLWSALMTFGHRSVISDCRPQWGRTNNHPVDAGAIVKNVMSGENRNMCTGCSSQGINYFQQSMLKVIFQPCSAHFVVLVFSFLFFFFKHFSIHFGHTRHHPDTSTLVIVPLKHKTETEGHLCQIVPHFFSVSLGVQMCKSLTSVCSGLATLAKANKQNVKLFQILHYFKKL